MQRQKDHITLHNITLRCRRRQPEKGTCMQRQKKTFGYIALRYAEDEDKRRSTCMQRQKEYITLHNITLRCIGRQAEKYTCKKR